MDAKTSDWLPGPSVCRCCLTEGCYKDISTEYFWMGKKEVYSEMLSDTFSISIAYSQSGGPNSNSRLICEPCIARLRDASDFRRQVLECEKTFMHHLDPGSSSVAELEIQPETMECEVKLERVKLEKRISDDDMDDRDFLDDDDDDDDLDDEPLTKLASKVPKKESVDLLDLLDNSKLTLKRKSAAKAKASAPKKAKTKKEPAKPAPSKVKPEKKKKGKSSKSSEATVVKKDKSNIKDLLQLHEKDKFNKQKYTIPRKEMKKNAVSILNCWSVSPFRWIKNRFKCAYCDDDFTEGSFLRKHVSRCSKKYTVKDIYRKFKEIPVINLDVTDAFCSFCAEPYANVAQMREHVIQHGFEFNKNHPDGVVPFALNDETWKCAICENKFNNFLKLYEHMNEHYPHYICATCGKPYMTIRRLRVHSNMHRTGSFPCDKCGRVFTVHSARVSHKALAHAKRPRYECPQCDMRFEFYYDRMAHLKKVHGVEEVTYPCAHCEKSFNSSTKRAIHKRVHLPPQDEFSCTQCEWKFKTNGALKRHMVKHTGERNFHCSVCGKSFLRSNALRTHLKTHQEVNCKWCGALFRQKTQLILHLSTVHPELTDSSSSDSDIA